MEYLHHSSVPATKSELDLFTIPPTQTAIDSYYEVEYRPSATLDSSRTYDFQIPASDDFTDLASTKVYVKLKFVDKNGDVKNGTFIPTRNLANTLFDQVDVFLGATNISTSNNLYFYQAYLEDILFKHKSELDNGFNLSISRQANGKVFDMYFSLHSPICQQDNLLLSNIPLTIRFTRNRDCFCYTSAVENEFSIVIESIKLYIRRARLFPDVQAGIMLGLEKSPAKYFITRNVLKTFSLSKGIGSSTIDNIFSGPLPRRMVVGFVNNRCFTGSEDASPYFFDHFNITHIGAYVDGNPCPSIAYEPDFTNKCYMREFVSLYKYMNQDEGIPQISIDYHDYGGGTTLFAFDFSPDGTLGSESGTVSLLKRGNIRIDVRFASALSEPVFMIVFAQFDNLIQIDKYRNVTTDF